MEFLFEKLKKQYENIPEDVRNAISSVEVSEQLQAIGAKHRLHLDVQEKLFDATGGVMLGLVHPRDYVRTLTRELGVEADAARAIAQDVNEQIFRPIRESLKTVHGIEGARTVETGIKEREKEVPETPPQGTSAFAKGGETPDTLPVETEDDEAPEFEKEYPQHTADEEISREETLRDIEEPDKIGTPLAPRGETPEEKPRDIVSEKLQKTFRLPPTKSEFGEEIIRETEAPEATPTAYKEPDPYREPIE